MQERVYTTVDKSEWGDGPWQNEPDKIQWEDEATGLPCLVTRGPSGAWCGYVGLAPGHPYFETDYTDVPWDAAEVHGGLTYSDHCAEGPEDSSICHVPEPGDADHVWWLGFDCSHSGDLAPGRAARERQMAEKAVAETGSPWPWGSLSGHPEMYCDLSYARREVTKLARQLHSQDAATAAATEKDSS